MKQNYKVFFASALLFASLSARAVVIDGLDYTVISEVDKTVSVKQVSSSSVSGDLTIPETVEINGNSYTVTAIENEAFISNNGLTSVVIPNTVVTIGSSAFDTAQKMSSVTIGTSVETIGEYAFGWCSALESVTIPDNVTSLGMGAFYLCRGLKSVSIGNGITSIEKQAFYSCRALEDLTIGTSVATIGENAFYCCRALDEVTLGEKVKSISTKAFELCDNISKIVVKSTTPPTIDNKAAFDDSVYESAKLYVPSGSEAAYKADAVWGLFTLDGEVTVGTTFTVGDIVYKVTAFSFDGHGRTVKVYMGKNNGLTSIVIPESVNYKGYAFAVTAIDENAFFQYTSLTEVSIGSSVETIGQCAFAMSSIKSITIPDKVKEIPDIAFFQCTSLTEVHLGSSVEKIGGSAFAFCAFKSIDIPASVTTIDQHAFEGNDQLTDIVIPDGVTSLVELAFTDCSALTTATIGNGVETIPQGLFQGCEALQKVFIGENVTMIMNDAFLTNTNLITEIHCRALNPPALTAEAFQYPEYEIATVYVPNEESKAAYQVADVWKNFTKIEVEDSYSGIDDIIGDVDNIAPVEYFNLQGVKVDRPEPSSIYIVKQGNKVSKILVK